MPNIEIDPATLTRESPEYRRLSKKHRLYEERLAKLNARPFLNEQEKVEAVKLKKQKLALKDRMAEIARQVGSKLPRQAEN